LFAPLVLQIQVAAVVVLETQQVVQTAALLVVQVTQRLLIGVNYGTTLCIS
jgi:hypothetical protein